MTPWLPRAFLGGPAVSRPSEGHFPRPTTPINSNSRSECRASGGLSRDLLASYFDQSALPLDFNVCLPRLGRFLLLARRNSEPFTWRIRQRPSFHRPRARLESNTCAHTLTSRWVDLISRLRDDGGRAVITRMLHPKDCTSESSLPPDFLFFFAFV